MADIQVYFDNAATTKPRKEAVEAFSQASEQLYANPNSAHAPGFAAERMLDGCRAKIADLMSANCEVVFTSSGSAANSLAILGAAASLGAKPRKCRVISSLAEHSSVRSTCKYLESIGHEVVYLTLDQEGRLTLRDLEAALDEHAALVTLMHVNNETGVISDIEAIHNIVKGRSPRSILHTDSAAGFGKHSLDMRYADVLTFASHKIGGPKGVGGMCVTTSLASSFDAQEGVVGMLRQGTPDLPAIAAFIKAAEIAFENMPRSARHAARIKEYIAEQTQGMERAINGGGSVSPYILNMSFAGVAAETLINRLSSRGVYVAAGSSCNSRKADRNILRHYGLARERIEGSVRLSFSDNNTMAEAACFVDEVGAALRLLRKFSKR